MTNRDMAHRAGIRGRRGLRAVVALAAALSAGACASTIEIEELLEDPARYDGETVRVEGEVEGAIGALGRGAYRISDGTGVLTVISERGGVPADGARVGVEGEFQALFTIGGTSLAALLEEDRFDP